MSDKYYQINYNALWDVISCILSQSNQDDKMAIWLTCIHTVSWAVDVNNGEWTKGQIVNIVDLIATRLWRASVTLKADAVVYDFPAEIISHYRKNEKVLVSGAEFSANEVTFRINYMFNRAKD